MGRQAWVSLVLGEDTREELLALVGQVQDVSPVALDAMARADLHMTLAFLGTSITKKQLAPAQRGALDVAMSAFDGAAAATLSLVGLELFPPGKQNLLIARFHADKTALARVRALQEACYTAGLLSHDEWARVVSAPFAPHITLGKFRGMRADQLAAVAAAVISIIVPAPPLALPFAGCFLSS